MAIETAGKTEQTKLVEESREERLNRLFYLEMTIQDKTASRQKLVDSANALKNEIKTYQKDKIDLLNLINSGQGTFITVAVNESEAEELDDEMPSEEELAEFDDPTNSEGDEAPSSVLEEIENLFADAEESTIAETSEPEDQNTEADSTAVFENLEENIPENIPSDESEVSQ